MALYIVNFIFDRMERSKEFESLIISIGSSNRCYPLQWSSTWIVESNLMAFQLGEKIKSHFTDQKDAFIIAQINPDNTALCGMINDGLKQILQPHPLCPERSEQEPH